MCLVKRSIYRYSPAELNIQKENITCTQGNEVNDWPDHFVWDIYHDNSWFLSPKFTEATNWGGLSDRKSRGPVLQRVWNDKYSSTCSRAVSLNFSALNRQRFIYMETSLLPVKGY